LTERGAVTVEKFQTPAAALLPQIVAAPRLANALFQGERQSANAIFESIYSARLLILLN